MIAIHLSFPKQECPVTFHMVHHLRGPKTATFNWTHFTRCHVFMIPARLTDLAAAGQGCHETIPTDYVLITIACSNRTEHLNTNNSASMRSEGNFCNPAIESHNNAAKHKSAWQLSYHNDAKYIGHVFYVLCKIFHVICVL